jgi:hypothetical protein
MANRVWNFKTVVSLGAYCGTTQLKYVHSAASLGLFEPTAGWPSTAAPSGGNLMDLDMLMTM